MVLNLDSQLEPPGELSRGFPAPETGSDLEQAGQGSS